MGNKEMLKVGILGASGYTGSRLAYYLSRHREAEISFVTSRQEKGRPFSDLYGELKSICDVPFVEPGEAVDIDIDILFTCAPDQTSMKVAPSYVDRGVAVIDLAGDFRMNSGEDYERWYGKPHVSPDYIARAVYGITELNRDKIKGARFISNPGCYPTSVQLGLAPLLREGLIDTSSIHVNSVSGVSGAGRSLKEFKLFYAADSNVLPYGFGRSHKHVGEMEQELSRIAGEPCMVTFAPHVVPMKTGIISTMLVTMKEETAIHHLNEMYGSFYGDDFFVRFTPGVLPQSKHVADTNFCDIGIVRVDGTDKLIVASAICNLGKGASGQAVQNMNVMFGIDEREGLI